MTGIALAVDAMGGDFGPRVTVPAALAVLRETPSLRLTFVGDESLINPLLARLRFLGTLMLGAYLLINLILAALAPVTAGWSTWSVTALAVPPMVLGMVYLVIPIARH